MIDFLSFEEIYKFQRNQLNNGYYVSVEDIQPGTVLCTTNNGNITIINCISKSEKLYATLKTNTNMLKISNDKKYGLILKNDKIFSFLSLTNPIETEIYKHNDFVTDYTFTYSLADTSPTIYFSDSKNNFVKYSKGLGFFKNTKQILKCESRILKIQQINKHIIVCTAIKIYILSEENDTLLYEIKTHNKYADIIDYNVTFFNGQMCIIAGNYSYVIDIQSKRHYMVNNLNNINVVSQTEQSSINVYTLNNKQYITFIQNGIEMTTKAILDDFIFKIIPVTSTCFLIAYHTAIYIAKVRSWMELFSHITKETLDYNYFSIQINKWKIYIPTNDRVEIVANYIRALFKAGEPLSRILTVLSDFIEPNGTEWSLTIELLKSETFFRHIANAVPIEILPNCDNSVDALLSLIEYNPSRLCAVFQSLDLSLKEAKEILPKLKDSKNPLLKMPLAFVLHECGQHTEALDVSLNAGYPYILKDIATYGQYPYALDHFNELFDRFGGLFTEFLVTYSSKILPQKTLTLFDSSMEQPMLEYMHALTMKGDDVPNEYKTKLVLLYLKFQHPATMAFLEHDQSFNFTQAIEFAKRYKRDRELAYILRKSGDIKQGMTIHIERIRNPAEAIEYAKAVENDDVWGMLISAAYEDQQLLMYMLDILPSLHIDAVSFIQNIPDEMWQQIDPTVLSGALKEYRHRLTAVKLSRNIISKAAFREFQNQLRQYKRGTVVREISV